MKTSLVITIIGVIIMLVRQQIKIRNQKLILALWREMIDHKINGLPLWPNAKIINKLPTKLIKSNACSGQIGWYYKKCLNRVNALEINNLISSIKRDIANKEKQEFLLWILKVQMKNLQLETLATIFVEAITNPKTLSFQTEEVTNFILKEVMLKSSMTTQFLGIFKQKTSESINNTTDNKAKTILKAKILEVYKFFGL